MQCLSSNLIMLISHDVDCTLICFLIPPVIPRYLILGKQRTDTYFTTLFRSSHNTIDCQRPTVLRYLQKAFLKMTMHILINHIRLFRTLTAMPSLVSSDGLQAKASRPDQNDGRPLPEKPASSGPGCGRKTPKLALRISLRYEWKLDFVPS